MPGQANGGESASAALSAAVESAAASNFGTGADSLPLNVPAPVVADDKAEKDSAEQKARNIFRKLQGDGDEEENADTDELEGTAADNDEGEEAGEADAEDASAQDQQAATSQAQGSDAEKAGKLKEATESLVRDGWTLADLEKLAPERVLELGTKARARQQAQDRFGSTKAQEVAQLKARLAELEGGAPQQPATEQQQQSPAAVASSSPPDAVMKVLKENMAKLGELASPEAAAVLEQTLTHIYTAASAQATQQMQQQLTAITAASEQQMLATARKALVTEFPDIKDEAKYGEVLKKTAALAKTGYYGPGDLESCMRDACRTMFQPTIKDVQRQMVERSKRAKNGQPDVGQQQASKEQKAASPTDLAKSALRGLKAGKSPEAVRRKLAAGR